MIKNILEVITLNKLKLSIMFILTLIVSIGTVYVVYARVLFGQKLALLFVF